ncbi:MAG: hypothetical protein RL757_173 [Bacteroidota bacterium]
MKIFLKNGLNTGGYHFFDFVLDFLPFVLSQLLPKLRKKPRVVRTRGFDVGIIFQKIKSHLLEFHLSEFDVGGNILLFQNLLIRKNSHRT